MKILSPNGEYTKKAMATHNEFKWVANMETIISAVADPSNKRGLVSQESHEKVRQLLSIYASDLHMDGAIYMALRGVRDNRSFAEMYEDADYSADIAKDIAEVSDKYYNAGSIQPEHIGLYIICWIFMQYYGFEFEIPGWENEEDENALKKEVNNILSKYDKKEYWYLSRTTLSIAIINANNRNVKMMSAWEEKHPRGYNTDWRPNVKDWSPDQDDDLFDD